MKIAITAQEPKVEALVDPRFGRAACFAIHDTATGTTDFADNGQNLNAPQGAGIQAATNLADTGAEALLTGNCGPKAFRALQTAGIAVYIGVEGTVAAAIEAFKGGTLKPAGEANVDGHWM